MLQATVISVRCPHINNLCGCVYTETSVGVGSANNVNIRTYMRMYIHVYVHTCTYMCMCNAGKFLSNLKSMYVRSSHDVRMYKNVNTCTYILYNYYTCIFTYVKTEVRT